MRRKEERSKQSQTNNKACMCIGGNVFVTLKSISQVCSATCIHIMKYTQCITAPEVYGKNHEEETEEVRRTTHKEITLDAGLNRS